MTTAYHDRQAPNLPCRGALRQTWLSKGRLRYVINTGSNLSIVFFGLCHAVLCNTHPPEQMRACGRAVSVERSRGLPRQTCMHSGPNHPKATSQRHDILEYPIESAAATMRTACVEPCWPTQRWCCLQPKGYKPVPGSRHLHHHHR